jgi:hypothetical protein
MTRLSKVYPFIEIPPLGTLVTDVDLADSMNPLLAGTYSLASALAEAADEGVLTAEELHPGLVLLAGLIGLAREVFDRWRPDEDAARPPGKAKKD